MPVGHTAAGIVARIAAFCAPSAAERGFLSEAVRQVAGGGRSPKVRLDVAVRGEALVLAARGVCDDTSACANGRCVLTQAHRSVSTVRIAAAATPTMQGSRAIQG